MVIPLIKQGDKTPLLNLELSSMRELQSIKRVFFSLSSFSLPLHNLQSEWEREKDTLLFVVNKNLHLSKFV